ncbi:MAG: hypothetical protein H6926_03520 [Chromatiales bacterium]|nr:hypothetical protein [Chromatiales bacterium]
MQPETLDPFRPAARSNYPQSHRTGHTEGTTAVATLPDGRLVSASDDHSLRIWATGDDGLWRSVQTLEGHSFRSTPLPSLITIVSSAPRTITPCASGPPTTTACGAPCIPSSGIPARERRHHPRSGPHRQRLR